MRVLVTGASGYIGKRIIQALLDNGHNVVALVRDPNRFRFIYSFEKVTIVKGDLADFESLKDIPDDIEGAYFLVHSMSDVRDDFPKLEEKIALNFLKAMEMRSIKHIVYLSGIVNDRLNASKHLASRAHVEQLILQGQIPATVLRAGLVIGSGSASFEIIRDLVEKLPIMVTPKWVKNRCALIAISDVLFYLVNVLGNPQCFNQSFEISSGEELTYKEIMLGYAKERGLKRKIFVLPVLTVKLSSYWLYFVTSVNYALASTLVQSLQNEVIRRDFRINSLIPHSCCSYQQALQKAFQKISQNEVISHWSDATSFNSLKSYDGIEFKPPREGTSSILVKRTLCSDRRAVIDKLWRIGGNNGWYYQTYLWKLRGFIDKCFGGVGLSRGRKNVATIATLDVIDFWRVLSCDYEKGELLLFAEMKLPGEAWLFIAVEEKEITLEAIFRPKGVFGRLYWYFLYPLHWNLYRGLAKKLARDS